MSCFISGTAEIQYSDRSVMLVINRNKTTEHAKEENFTDKGMGENSIMQNASTLREEFKRRVKHMGQSSMHDGAVYAFR